MFEYLMMTTTDVKYENLDCYILNDQPTKGGMLGTIFRKAQNKIQDPAKLVSNQLKFT